MTVIITMSGLGSRFRMEGYEKPKHMIEVNGKTLFEWSLLSLKNFNNHHYIFACLKEHNIEWIHNVLKNSAIKNYQIYSRENVSRGQAETAYDVIKNVEFNTNDELWVYNIDTYISDGINPSDLKGFDACLHVFNSTNPSMSFVRYHSNNTVAEIAEKKVISNFASVGIYAFKSSLLYVDLYESLYLLNKSSDLSEFYVAPMLNIALKCGMLVNAPKLLNNNVYILGTPSDVKDFEINFK